MRAGETATINLDLSSPTSKEKLVRTAEPYEKGAYYKVVDSIYEDEWFDGSARLVDGSTLAWSIAEEVTVSKRTKRTSRGKHKTKTRSYKRVRMTVDLALPSKTYAVDPGAAGTATDAKVRAKEGEKRNTLHLSRRIKVRSENPIHPRVFHPSRLRGPADQELRRVWAHDVHPSYVTRQRLHAVPRMLGQISPGDVRRRPETRRG
jgi:hypothetical protein